MARVPPVEAVLLQLHNALQIKCFEDKGKTAEKLKRLGLPLTSHVDSLQALIEEGLTALGLEPSSKIDAFRGFIEMANFYMALEKRIWTHAATEAQIIWHLAAYFWTPSLARRIAFWNLEGALDVGMPGGKFWYLPEIRDANGKPKLVLPVTQVVEWLLDLLGQTMDSATRGMGASNEKEDDSIERVLYNWLAGDLPHIDNVERYFSEDALLEFRGTFTANKTKSPSEQFEDALRFVGIKDLSAGTLRDEIPMTQPARLETILAREATDEENEMFCDLLAKRYATPSLRIIRQRLRIARMTQYAYIELGKLLQGKAFDPKLPDPSVNKVLQLAAIFTDVYNRTLDAHKNCESLEAENQWFERKLPPWHSEGIFRAILPVSQYGAVDAVADVLNRRFEDMREDAQLEDHVGHTAEPSKSPIERELRRLQKTVQEQRMVQDFAEDLKNKPHWSLAAKVNDFSIVKEIALRDSCSLKMRRIALQRAKQLATGSDQKMAVACIELSQLLNAPDCNFRPKDSQALVQHLLDQAKSNDAYRYWSAMVLQFEAKHHLAMNMMDDAQKRFDEALEECQTQSFGELKGKIARDAFAAVVEFQRNGFDLANQQKYYRNMLSFETLQRNIKGGVPAFEDVALEVSEHFWESLYFPYEGLESMSPSSREKWDQVTKGTREMIAHADWGQLEAWFVKNKTLLGKRLGDVRANTVLIGWLKLLYEEEAQQGRLLAFLPSDLKSNTETFGSMRQRWREAIGRLVIAAPKAVNLHDFKRQTPLMLAANAGDEVLVRTLLKARADAEKFDFLGRTALHAAVAKRSLPCVELILEASPKTAFVKTKDGLCALHTALRMGDAAIVRALSRSAPDTLLIKSNADQTPVELADLISNDPMFVKELRSFMTSERRLPATETEYKDAALILNARFDHSAEATWHAKHQAT